MRYSEALVYTTWQMICSRTPYCGTTNTNTTILKLNDVSACFLLFFFFLHFFSYENKWAWRLCSYGSSDTLGTSTSSGCGFHTRTHRETQSTGIVRVLVSRSVLFSVWREFLNSLASRSRLLRCGNHHTLNKPAEVKCECVCVCMFVCVLWELNYSVFVNIILYNYYYNSTMSKSGPVYTLKIDNTKLYLSFLLGRMFVIT